MQIYSLKFIIFLKFLIKSFNFKISLDKQFTIYFYNLQILNKFNWFLKNLLINFDKFIDMHLIEYLSKLYIYSIFFSIKDNYNLIIINSLTTKFNLKKKTQNALNLNKISTFTKKYFATSWLEREIWDMYGVKFNNHSNLKRILSDYGFTQHPLKKNFPVIGFFQLDFSVYQGLILYNII